MRHSRYPFIIAATLMTVSAQAQPWRYAQQHGAPFPHFAPGRPGGFGMPQLFRHTPAMPFYAPPHAPAFRPPVYAAVPHPFVREPLARVAPFIVPVPSMPVAPVVPVAPAMPVQPAPYIPPVAQPAEIAPYAPPPARIAPQMTEVRNVREPEPASVSAPLAGIGSMAGGGWLSGLPLKLLVPVAGIGALAWYGRRRMKGAGAPKNANDYAELPY
jgi:hypothetical protein